MESWFECKRSKGLRFWFLAILVWDCAIGIENSIPIKWLYTDYFYLISDGCQTSVE